jgi:cell division protein FtsQ
MTLPSLKASGFSWSKLASLALLGLTVSCLVWMQTDSRWYISRDSTNFVGQRLVTADSLFESSQVNGWNLFWLRRDEIRDRLLENPWIDDAEVSLALPAGLQVRVKEAPAIGLWETQSGQFWISPTGAAFPAPDEAPVNMPRLVDQRMDAAAPGSVLGTAVDTEIVASALALVSQVSGVTEVQYSPEVGLNFGLPGTQLWVYWGDGEQVESKLKAIALGRRLHSDDKSSGAVLDVRIPDKLVLR